MNENTLDPRKLLEGNDYRLTLHAILVPVGDRDRIQPAGFPDVGHVIYDSPQSDGTIKKVCIVDSAASMANHLETVCHEGPFGAALHSELKGLPYVQCMTDDNNNGKSRLVATTLSEGHRLASSLFMDAKSEVVKAPVGIQRIEDKNENLELLLRREFNLEDLGTSSHPFPSDWWNVFLTIFTFDPNSLVHGILFPSMGIKIPRALTAQLDAIDAARVVSSGVKFDKLGITTSGQPIFAKDEETATEIRATFVIDLALIRSFGSDSEGLNANQKTLLVAFALWKIARLLKQPFRYRSGCDLEFQALHVSGNRSKSVALPEIKISDFIGDGIFSGEPENRVTQIYWPKEELLKKAKDTAESADDSEERDDEDEDAP